MLVVHCKTFVICMFEQFTMILYCGCVTGTITHCTTSIKLWSWILCDLSGVQQILCNLKPYVGWKCEPTTFYLIRSPPCTLHLSPPHPAVTWPINRPSYFIDKQTKSAGIVWFLFLGGYVLEPFYSLPASVDVLWCGLQSC